MEVRDIEAIPLSHSLPEKRGVGSARGVHTNRATTLIRLETADGLVGWGEAFAPARTVATLAQEQFADRVKGLNPHDAETFVEESYTHGYHFGRSAFTRCAVSGIDIALWDLVGKSVGAPVSELLGRRRDVLEPYASSGYITEWNQPIEEPMRAAVADGFTAAKIKIGRGIEDDYNRVSTAREILGDDATLMVDFNGNYRAKQAIRAVNELTEFNVGWVEEPVAAEDVDGLRRVTETVDVPVAAGEAHFSRFEFERLADERAVDVLQPNLGRCGGFTEARALADLAMSKNLTVRPHVWNSAVGVAAAIQFAASVPQYPHEANIPEPLLFEYDRSSNPLRSDLLVEPFDPTDGELAVPQGSGLGVEIDEAAVERFRVD
ncbi:mandelate racemase (plasmid) [Halostagnicola larsenii XH-48]|uniref:Mandelate racemase n=1 Tax=Halostagnicola larsenii XH-48 TaxID=797299 RepID=W0JX93_9EURY|nr:mandelate racemase/muconate lactonizing enzyme family protein [Halostagnicola larsenii]AHG01825.1 mandelate racemase [Halostagnicola larsenii XH-48]